MTIKPNLYSDLDYSDLVGKTGGWSSVGTSGASYVATTTPQADGRIGVNITTDNASFTASANYTRNLAAIGLVEGQSGQSVTVSARIPSRTGSGSVQIFFYQFTGLNGSGTLISTDTYSVPASIAAGSDALYSRLIAIDPTTRSFRWRVQVLNSANSVTIMDIMLAAGCSADYRPYLPELMPGMTQLYAGTTAPKGTIQVTGQTISRAQYAGIFAVVGTLFGAGDGSTTFTLPPAIPATGYITVMKT